MESMDDGAFFREQFCFQIEYRKRTLYPKGLPLGPKNLYCLTDTFLKITIKNEI